MSPKFANTLHGVKLFSPSSLLKTCFVPGELPRIVLNSLSFLLFISTVTLPCLWLCFLPLYIQITQVPQSLLLMKQMRWRGIYTSSVSSAFSSAAKPPATGSPVPFGLKPYPPKQLSMPLTHPVSGLQSPISGLQLLGVFLHEYPASLLFSRALCVCSSTNMKTKYASLILLLFICPLSFFSSWVVCVCARAYVCVYVCCLQPD